MARPLSFGPGVAIPFTGEPPQFRYADGWKTRVWECDRCGVSVPAGVIPFPHNGDCSPGTVVVSRFSWDLRCWRFEDCLNEIGDAVAQLFWTPVSYTAKTAQERAGAFGSP